jgi:hypothetical protein
MFGFDIGRLLVEQLNEDQSIGSRLGSSQGGLPQTEERISYGLQSSRQIMRPDRSNLDMFITLARP